MASAQSITTVLLRTPITQMIFFNQFITVIIQGNEHAIYLLNLGESDLLLPKLNYSFSRDHEFIHMQFLSPFFIKSRQTFNIGAQQQY